MASVDEAPVEEQEQRAPADPDKWMAKERFVDSLSPEDRIVFRNEVEPHIVPDSNAPGNRNRAPQAPAPVVSAPAPAKTPADPDEWMARQQPEQPASITPPVTSPAQPPAQPPVQQPSAQRPPAARPSLWDDVTSGVRGAVAGPWHLSQPKPPVPSPVLPPPVQQPQPLRPASGAELPVGPAKTGPDEWDRAIAAPTYNRVSGYPGGMPPPAPAAPLAPGLKLPQTAATGPVDWSRISPANINETRDYVMEALENVSHPQHDDVVRHLREDPQLAVTLGFSISPQMARRFGVSPTTARGALEFAKPLEPGAKPAAPQIQEPAPPPERPQYSEKNLPPPVDIYRSTGGQTYRGPQGQTVTLPSEDENISTAEDIRRDLVRQNPEAAQALQDLKTLLLGPAYGTQLESSGFAEDAINLLLRASAQFSTPEGIATAFAGAGIASKLGDLLEMPRVAAALEQYPKIRAGVEAAARGAVPAGFGIQSGTAAVHNIREGIRTGNQEQIGQGLIDSAFTILMGGHVAAEAVNIAWERMQAKAAQSGPGQPDDPVSAAFRTLGVDPNATRDEARSAYRAYSKQWHADAPGGGNHEKMADGAAAYAVLEDYFRRGQPTYEERLAAEEQQQAAAKAAGQAWPQQPRGLPPPVGQETPSEAQAQAEAAPEGRRGRFTGAAAAGVPGLTYEPLGEEGAPSGAASPIPPPVGRPSAPEVQAEAPAESVVPPPVGTVVGPESLTPEIREQMRQQFGPEGASVKEIAKHLPITDVNLYLRMLGRPLAGSKLARAQAIKDAVMGWSAAVEEKAPSSSLVPPPVGQPQAEEPQKPEGITPEVGVGGMPQRQEPDVYEGRRAVHLDPAKMDQATFDQWVRLRQLLSGVGNLGFDTTKEAVQAILMHSDWAKRWDIDAARGPEEAELVRLGNKFGGWERGLPEAPPKPPLQLPPPVGQEQQPQPQGLDAIEEQLKGFRRESFRDGQELGFKNGVYDPSEEEKAEAERRHAARDKKAQELLAPLSDDDLVKLFIGENRFDIAEGKDPSPMAANGAWDYAAVEWLRRKKAVTPQEQPPQPAAANLPPPVGQEPVPQPKAAAQLPPPVGQAARPVEPEEAQGSMFDMGDQEPARDKVYASRYADLAPHDVELDPVRFQFKQEGVGQKGVTDQFKDITTWDPNLAGTVHVWRDPANGKTYAVNGHHRVHLAQRLVEQYGPQAVPEGLHVRYLDASTAEKARAKGALINIAEGNGTPLDVAKFFRDSDETPEKLEAGGAVKLNRRSGRLGAGLSKLAQPIFDDAVAGILSAERGAIIGANIPNHIDQRNFYDLVKARERAGRRMTDAQMMELIRLNKAVPTVKKKSDQGDLWGEDEIEQNLLPEKAEISDYVRKQLAAEKRLFGAVGTQAAAERLGEAGNVIKAEENAEVAERANQGIYVYDQLSTVTGPVDDLLNQAAKEVADGQDLNEVKRRAYTAIRAEVQRAAAQFAGRPQEPGGYEERGSGVESLRPRRRGKDGSGELFHGPGELPFEQPARPPAEGPARGVEGQESFLSPEEEARSKALEELRQKKLLGERLTAQMKSGQAVRSSNLKPAQQRGMSEEEGPEQGGLDLSGEAPASQLPPVGHAPARPSIPERPSLEREPRGAVAQRNMRIADLEMLGDRRTPEEQRELDDLRQVSAQRKAVRRTQFEREQAPLFAEQIPEARPEDFVKADEERERSRRELYEKFEQNARDYRSAVAAAVTPERLAEMDQKWEKFMGPHTPIYHSSYWTERYRETFHKNPPDVSYERGGKLIYGGPWPIPKTEGEKLAAERGLTEEDYLEFGRGKGEEPELQARISQVAPGSRSEAPGGRPGAESDVPGAIEGGERAGAQGQREEEVSALRPDEGHETTREDLRGAANRPHIISVDPNSIWRLHDPDRPADTSREEAQRFFDQADAYVSTVGGVPAVFINEPAMDLLLHARGLWTTTKTGATSIGSAMRPGQWQKILQYEVKATQRVLQGKANLSDEPMLHVISQIRKALGMPTLEEQIKAIPPGVTGHALARRLQSEWSANKVRQIILSQVGSSLTPEEVKTVVEEEYDHIQHMQLPGGMQALPLHITEFSPLGQQAAKNLAQKFRYPELVPSDHPDRMEINSVITSEVLVRLMRPDRWRDLVSSPQDAMQLAWDYRNALKSLGPKVDAIIDQIHDVVTGLQKTITSGSEAGYPATQEAGAPARPRGPPGTGEDVSGGEREGPAGWTHTEGDWTPAEDIPGHAERFFPQDVEALGSKAARKAAEFAAKAAAKTKAGRALGVDPSVQREIIPWIDRYEKAINQVLAATSPTSIEGAEAASLPMRAHLAHMDRMQKQASIALEKLRGPLGSLSQNQRWKFIIRAESNRPQVDATLPNGKVIPAKELDRIAGVFRDVNDKIRAEVEDADDPGVQRIWREVFWPNFWKETSTIPPGVAGTAQYGMPTGVSGRAPMAGPRGFEKRKVFDTFLDGVSAGYTPLYDNPVDYWQAKMREMTKYAMFTRLMRDIDPLAKFKGFTEKMPPGYAKVNDPFARVLQFSKTEKGFVARGEWVYPEAAARIINNHLSPDPRQTMSLWKLVADLGNAWVRWKLSGFFHFGTTALNSIYSHVALGARMAADGDMKGAAKQLVNAPIAPVADLIRGSRLQRRFLDLNGTQDAVFKALEEGGYRAGKDPYISSNMRERMLAGWRAGERIMPWKYLGAALDTIAIPIVDKYVPYLKMAAISDLARFEIERYQKKNAGMMPDPPRLRKIMADAVDSVDNRFGQLAYDNLFLNRSQKATFMSLIMSLGWNLGTFRELGGALFKDIPGNIAAGGRAVRRAAARQYLKAMPLPPRGRPPKGIAQRLQQKASQVSAQPINAPGMTNRIAYLAAMIAFHTMLAALYQKFMTGKNLGSVKDAVYPQDGGYDERGHDTRTSFPDYMKEMWNWANDPENSVINKTHPMLSLALKLINNRDYWGSKIQNFTDDASDRLSQLVDYFKREELPPLWLNNLEKMAQRAGESGPSLFPPSLGGYLKHHTARAVASQVGFNPAPAWIGMTPAERLVAEYTREYQPVGGRDIEETQRTTARSAIIRAIRLGQSEQPAIDNALRQGLLTGKDIANAYKAAEISPLEASLSRDRFSPPQILKIWEVADQEERKQIEDLVQLRLNRLANRPGVHWPSAAREKAKKYFDIDVEPRGDLETPPIPNIILPPRVGAGR